jgi:mono/diheme cytochrome c family protein
MSTTAKSSLKLVMASAAFLLSAAAFGQYEDDNKSCIDCHSNPRTKTDFCDVVPAEVWERQDKHRQAFKLLHESNSTDPAAREKKQALVTQILGFELLEVFVKNRDNPYSELIDATDKDAKTQEHVATVKACLRCHGTWPKSADANFKTAPPVPLDMGVSCQACHGPGTSWEQPHRTEAWRRVTPEGKKELGFTDCRSPIGKAKLCASCHVGNVAEEKFVKHEWYAAGHPPLPSFELASFETQMPRHWKSLREKGNFKYRDPSSTGPEALTVNQRNQFEQAKILDDVRDSYLEANFPIAIAKGLQPAADLTGAKDAIVGGVMAYSTYILSLADNSAALVADNKANWPELALYDCSACHHELRSGQGANSRPKRNHMPGRPPLTMWPEVLTRLAAAQADGYPAASAATRWPKIRDLIAKLDKAATDKPFGDSALMSSVNKDSSPNKSSPAVILAAALKELADDVSNTRFDHEAARSALKFLANPENYESADFYTARQIAWAFSAIANDLQPGSGPTLFSQNTDDPLALRLPAGPDRSVMDNLRRWLPAAGKYDPASFQKQLDTLPLR